MILFKFFILGVLSALLFPPFFMLPLGLIIFPYIIYLLNHDCNRQSFITYFFLGFFYGLGFLLFFLFWIYNPFLVNLETKNFAILAFILPIFLSLFFGLGFIIYKYIYNIFNLIIFTPIIFLFIELLISNIFYGFPWVTFSFILSNNFLGFYFLKYFGTYVSSYLIIIIFILPIIFIYSNKLKKIKVFILIAHLPFFIAFIFLFLTSHSSKIEQSKEINIQVFQILSPIYSLDKDLIEKDIINKIINSNSEYLFFAENNYPYLISDISAINILKHVRDNKKVIIGTTRVENNRLYNSFLFLEKNKIQVFDKQILVPFGEFLPFRSYLKFMEKITGNLDFTVGNNKRLIQSSEINILPIICYEIIFNKIYKNINENKIDILINITNDSWFGDKLGPYQHFYHSRMRAIISNKYLIRISNNGISAIIDNNGKIINFSKLQTKTSFINLLKIKNTIYYKSIHSFFLFYLIFIIFIYFIFVKYIIRHDT